MANAQKTHGGILDAFETVLIDHGERAATLDAVAAAAGVSKGGLLYHFASKDALVAGLAERLDVLGRADVESLRHSDDAVASFIRGSVVRDTPIDRTFVALLRLVQADQHPEARAAIDRLDNDYLSVMAETVGPDLGAVIARLSDGLYLRSALDPRRSATSAEVESLVRTVEAIVRSAG